MRRVLNIFNGHLRAVFVAQQHGFHRNVHVYVEVANGKFLHRRLRNGPAFEHTHDGQPVVAALERLPDGVDVGEKPRLHVAANDADRFGTFKLIVRKQFALSHLNARHLKVVVVDADQFTVVFNAFPQKHRLNFNFRTDVTHNRNGGDILGVEQTETRRKPLLFAFAGVFIVLLKLLVGVFDLAFDDNVVGTHLPDLFQDFALGPGPDGQHGNDRRHAKNNAQRGQQGPKAVVDQRVQGDAEVE